MTKESFIFYRDWYDGMRGLPLQVRAELYDAIVAFALDGEDVPLSAEAAMIFSFLRPKLVRDASKYEERCERNRRNGRNGGRPRKPTETEENPQNPVGYSKTHKNPQNPVGGDKDNDKDKDNDIVDDNIPSSLRSEGSSHGAAEATRPQTFRGMVVRRFNEAVSGKAIKPIRAITEGTQRAEWLRARMREYGSHAVLEVIDKAAASSFLNGGNRRCWAATFDWLMRPNNFPKVLEGNYDDDKVDDKLAEQQIEWQ